MFWESDISWKLETKQIKLKEHRLYIEMWRKAKDCDNITRAKPKQKKCPDLKHTFNPEPHFNPEHTNQSDDPRKKIEYVPL